MAFKTRKARGKRVASKGGVSHQPKRDHIAIRKRQKLEEQKNKRKLKTNTRVDEKINNEKGIGYLTFSY